MSTSRQKPQRATQADPADRAPYRPPLVLAPTERRILGAVAHAGGLTRADIARELRLSRSKLSPVILALLEEGLLVPTGHQDSRGGRRGDLLGAAGPESAVVAGLEIDIDRLRVVIATVGMHIVATAYERLDAAGDPERAVATATEIITRSIDEGWGPLVGIGISLPAAIDTATGAAAVAPAMPDWVGFPIAERLSDAFATRVFVDSDLNALALAEMTAPHHPPLGPAFLVVKAHEGIGCGIVVNRAIFRGSHGSAGEIGHISADPEDDTICACGHRGCLEALVQPGNLAARARELAARERASLLRPPLDHKAVTLDEIGQAARDGDPIATLLMRELGMRIGFVLAGTVSFFNPSSIVVSTARMLGSEVLMGAIRQGIYERAFPGVTRRLQIVESELGDDAVAIGAAVLARDGFLGMAGKVAHSRGLVAAPEQA
jgi:predicted NBD/HSP70 family sugar kinase